MRPVPLELEVLTVYMVVLDLLDLLVCRAFQARRLSLARLGR